MYMDINNTLLNETKNYLYKYAPSNNKIAHFLTHGKPLLKRQREAINIIDEIMTKHGKRKLLPPISELARIENNILELEPHFRDHVVHALLSFILGIYLNEKFLCKPADIFQWKLAGLLHDFGYPIQIAKDILEPFTAKINEINRKLKISISDVHFKIVPDGLENLTNNINSFDLIQKCLYDWGLHINVKEEYNKNIKSADICHGMISSLVILYLIDLMYQKHNPKRKCRDIYRNRINWNQKYFNIDVVSACSAIYIHNLPERCFTDAKIDRYESPIAFLLKLSDCLQEWERPSKENEKGIPSNKFDIRIDNNKLIFCTDIPDNIKDKIKGEISSYLIAPDVKIC